MKKQLLSVLAFGAMTGSVLAQLPASTVATTKSALIEEFTGVHCGFCPDGHKIATNIKNANPTKVVLVNIHANSFAIPGPMQPDLRTTEGTAIDAAFPVVAGNGYPNGNVGRAVYSGSVNMMRGSWSAATNSVLTKNAECNVAVQGTLDVQTRVLQVQAQVYYTSNSPTSTNYLTIQLVESNILGYQSDYGNYNPTNWMTVFPSGKTYRHNHALRKSLTATMGDAVTPTTAGSTFNSPIYTYTVPATFGSGSYVNNCTLGNLDLVAFVTTTNTTSGNNSTSSGPVINACNGPIALTNFANAVDIAPVLYADNNVCTAKFNTAFKFFNYGSSNVTNAVVAYTVNNGALQTYTSTATVKPYTWSDQIFIPTYNFVPTATNTMALNVVSVNSGADLNSANNLATKNPAMAPIASSTSFTMNFNHDRFGSECSWYIQDEGTSTTVAFDGPWTNLSANGTALKTKVFNLTNQNTCYKLYVKDTGGDGINGGWGAGSFQLLNGSSTLVNWTTTNYFTYETDGWFITATNLGVEGTKLNISDVGIYPNPTTDNAYLTVEMLQNENVNVTVLNNLGQVVYNQNLTLDAGKNEVNLNTQNWSSGIYNINLTTAKGTVNKKLTVTK